jgi:hypothetical protein
MRSRKRGSGVNDIICVDVLLNRRDGVVRSHHDE